MHLSFQEWLILTRLILPWTKHYIDFSKYVTSHLMPGISLYLSAWRNQGLFPVKLFHWLRCPQIFVLVTICNKLNQLARRFFFYSLPFSLPTTLECSNYFFPVLLPRGQVLPHFFGTLILFKTSLLEIPRSIFINTAYFTSSVCSWWRRLFPAMLAISSKPQQQLRSYVHVNS